MSPIIAPIFFVVFVLMSQFVLVNVVVAVLMKHLEESNKNMGDAGSEAGGATTPGTDTEFPKTDTEDKESEKDTDVMLLGSISLVIYIYVHAECISTIHTIYHIISYGFRLLVRIKRKEIYWRCIGQRGNKSLCRLI